MASRGKAVLLAAVALSTTGCLRGCTSSEPPIHLQRNMYHQPKYRPQAASDFFYDGATMRPAVEGTVARGELHEDKAFFLGVDAAGQPLAASPVEFTDAVKARGAERYHIYCAPCHDARGDGKGILFQRGKVPTASFHDAKLRAATDGQIFAVITNGFGLMGAYRAQIPPADRWAIIAHVRALQQKRLTEMAEAGTPAPAATPAPTPTAEAAQP
jgi:mono/diheme cytochrome c family protein